MKRFWLVLLSLALITAFSTAAMAVDVKVSGEYYAGGLYMDKTTLQKNYGPNTAFFYQRLRLTTQFVVSPGLTLNARMDVMERAWGATRSAATTATATYNTATSAVTVTTSSAALDTMSAGTRAENENIAFDLLYVSYISPIGIFNAGYQIDGAWGTVFGDNSYPTPKLVYNFVMGGFVAGLQTGIYPGGENNQTAIKVADGADKDNAFYTAFVRYGWKTGVAGILFKWNDYRSGRNTVHPTYGPFGYKTAYLATLPYAKAKFGPVDVQAEIIWLYGKYMDPEEGSNAPKVDWNGLAAWVDATADFGMFYAGGTLAYMSGDDPSSTDKREASGGGGLDWNPCLIMFNSEIGYWTGTQAGYADGTTFASANGNPMNNAWFFQLKGGVKPVDKLNIGMSVSYANAVVKPTVNWLYNDYGWEIDATATYKITNNLSYMLGGGYLFTGKYFKGTGDSNEVQNNYLVLNKLTLTF